MVLVKKHYADKALRNRKRKWKLKHMEGFPHMDTESCNDEFNDFAVSHFFLISCDIELPRTRKLLSLFRLGLVSDVGVSDLVFT